MFNGQTLFVTGGTGSFGKQFIAHVLSAYTPKKIIVFSRDELKQFEMAQMSPFQEHGERLSFVLGDIRDLDRLKQAIEGVDYLIHAAALKQILTGEYHPQECIKTNILGTANVIDAAIAKKVGKVVSLSTDKAAYPVNLYGGSKFISDKLVSLAHLRPDRPQTRFVVVRYGNVIGSRGSVVGVFQNLIRQNVASLPVTDFRMSRFWLPLSRAIQLVEEAFLCGRGGEIFVAKIPSIRIKDLATALAPHLPQKEVGRRAGEKLHEDMITPDIAHCVLEFDNHYMIRPEIASETGGSFNPLTDLRGRQGAPVAENFSYNSGTNEHFLTVEEIRAFFQNAEPDNSLAS